MFCPGKQTDYPFSALEKQCNVDQRLWRLAGGIYQQRNSAFHALDQGRSIPTLEHEDVPCIIRHDNAIDLLQVVLDGKKLPRTGLKMHVIGGGGAALRTVIDNEVSGQARCDIEHIP